MELSEVRRETKRDKVLDALGSYDACTSACRWIASLPPQTNAQGIWNRCRVGAWMEWLFCVLGDTGDDLARKADTAVENQRIVFGGLGYAFIPDDEEEGQAMLADWIRERYESPWL